MLVPIWAAMAAIKKHVTLQTFVLDAHQVLSAPQTYPYGTTHLGSKMALSWHKTVAIREWHKRCKSHRRRRYNQRFRANPTDKYASQWSSKPEARSFTGKHICQLDLRGIADYRSSSIGFATFDNLRCWQDNHLHTIE